MSGICQDVKSTLLHDDFITTMIHSACISFLFLGRDTHLVTTVAQPCRHNSVLPISLVKYTCNHHPPQQTYQWCPQTRTNPGRWWKNHPKERE
jgi:hypothetical protein